MTDISELHRALIERVRDGDGRAPLELRRAAFDDAGLAEPIRTLIDKVAHQAYEVTDDDFDAVRQSGLAEDQIFEIVISAAVGQATRQYQSGLAALNAATSGGQ